MHSQPLRHNKIATPQSSDSSEHDNRDREHARPFVRLALSMVPPGTDLKRELQNRGLTLKPGHLQIGNLRIRAQLNLNKNILYYDLTSINELKYALLNSGHEIHLDPLDLILAHELFHLLIPDCPRQLAETAAHMFVTEVLNLPFFAGKLDTCETSPSDYAQS